MQCELENQFRLLADNKRNLLENGVRFSLELCEKRFFQNHTRTYITADFVAFILQLFFKNKSYSFV